MINNDKKWYSGILCKLNDENVNYRAEIAFNEHHQSIVIVYNVSIKWKKEIENQKSNSAVLRLENGEYVSIFDFYIEQSVSKLKMIEEKPVCNGIELTLVSSKAIRGARSFSKEHPFSEIHMEITEGHELIGICPYKFKSDDIFSTIGNQFEISIQITPIIVNTILGRFEFNVLPKQYYKRESFSIGFAHNIQFMPAKPIKVEEFHVILQKLSSFFFILCGEAITINKLWVVENKDNSHEKYEFIGYCNFPKDKLRKFENSGTDTTGYKRVSIFKLSDFANLEFAMNYWFEHYENLFNAQQAYSRIIQDEEMNIIPINRFLAAMQLIEGYSQAYTDEEQEIAEFIQNKDRIIDKLTEQEDKELVNNGLGFSGISFRKATTNFLYEGINYFEKMSRNLFNKNYSELIENIINDRNFYTHSSNRARPILNISDIINVGTLCKEIYRILILGKMGLPEQLLRCRIRHDFRATCLLADLLKVEIKDYGSITEFDAAMKNFSDLR
ncbi:MAG: hypothetical protein NC251_06110 [Lachnoclostridium sp.]|nr:hypothetical protein [Lachnospira sp.]MCM1247988.1 hypothetical protein [Lachnoclostridium sp.]